MNSARTADQVAARSELECEFLMNDELLRSFGEARLATATDEELRAALRAWNLRTVTLDLGNNESVSRGVFPQANGMFLAMTFTRSKWFKTRGGAECWLARRVG